MRHGLFILVVLALLSGTAAAQLVYQTAVPANNTTHSVDVLLTATAGSLRVTGFELYLNAGSHPVTIQYATTPNAGTSSPFITVGTPTVYSLGMGAPTIIPMDLDVIVPDQGGVTFRLVTSLSAAIGIDTTQSQYPLGPQGLLVTTQPAYVINNYVNANFCGRINYATTVGGDRTEFGVNIGSPLQGFLSPGVTFDIEAHDQDVVVDGFLIRSALAFNRYALYTTKSVDSYANVSFDTNSWRIVGDSGTFLTASNTPFWLPIDFEIVIPKGTRRGFYLVDVQHGSLDTGTISGSGILRTNADMSFRSGELHSNVGGTFGAATGLGYLNCTIRYRVPGRASITPGATQTLISNVPAATTGRGIAFDLAATTSQQLVGIVGNASKTGASFPPVTTTVELWTTLDGSSHVGKVGTSSAWKKLGTISVATGSGLPGLFSFLGLQSYIEEGSSRGFYLTTSDPQTTFQLQGGLGSPGIVTTSGSISMSTGELTSSPFVPAGTGYGIALTAITVESGRADRGFHEDFETGGSTQPPQGWLATADGTTNPLQAWRFDNPSAIQLYYPTTGKRAIFDSGFTGANNPVSGSLCSPRFDASRSLDYELQFTHRFVGSGTNQGWIEVWDGTAWNQIDTYTTTSSSSALRRNYNVTAAAGSCPNAMVRFRYQGNGSGFWVLDDVGVGITQKGQRPQLDLGEFDINYATDALHGQPVSCGLPGPYVATASINGPTIFHWEGEPLQPIQLFAGNLNIGNVVLSPQGQLDVGSYDPMTMTFPGLLLLADGTAPDIFNAAFRTSNGGELTMAVWFPPYLSGFTIHMQSLVFSSIQNIALTNMITLTVQ